MREDAPGEQAKANNVPGVFLAGFAKPESGGVVRFRFVNPLSRGGVHVKQSLSW